MGFLTKIVSYLLYSSACVVILSGRTFQAVILRLCPNLEYRAKRLQEQCGWWWKTGPVHNFSGKLRVVTPARWDWRSGKGRPSNMAQ